jgi:hypothetical protein
MHEVFNRRARQRTLFRQEHTQGIVYQRLALSGRQVQNLQVFPVGPAFGTFA